MSQIQQRTSTIEYKNSRAQLRSCKANSRLARKNILLLLWNLKDSLLCKQKPTIFWVRRLKP